MFLHMLLTYYITRSTNEHSIMSKPRVLQIELLVICKQGVQIKFLKNSKHAYRHAFPDVRDDGAD